MPTQDPADGAHLRLPAEVARLEKAVAFFTDQKDEKMLSQVVPQLAGAKDRLEHALKAVAFVDSLGLDHKVVPGKYTYNDALNVAAKVLHEHHQNTSGKFSIKSLYHRSHAHLKGVNGGLHCDESKLGDFHGGASELIEHLGLTDPKHIASANSLFVEETK